MKTVNEIMSYGEIYEIASKFVSNFTDVNNIYLPAAVAFSIQKNKQNFLAIAGDIETARVGIISKYNINTDNANEFRVAEKDIESANKELAELLRIQEEVKIYTFSIEEIQEAKFTPLQMEAILFMIKD